MSKQPIKEIRDSDGFLHEIHHEAISYIDVPNIRRRGRLYYIITNLRSKRIKYIDDNYEVKSTDNKNSFKILK